MHHEPDFTWYKDLSDLENLVRIDYFRIIAPSVIAKSATGRKCPNGTGWVRVGNFAPYGTTEKNGREPGGLEAITATHLRLYIDPEWQNVSPVQKARVEIALIIESKICEVAVTRGCLVWLKTDGQDFSTIYHAAEAALAIRKVTQ